MSTTPTCRPIPLGLTLLIATFSALVALALSGGHDDHPHRATDHHAVGYARAPGSSISQQEVALRPEMRRLWKDHVA
jgi:hypothetical protein